MNESSGAEFRHFNLLESSSNLSLDDASQSCSSEYTSASASTNPGPGSLSGKGILAFGKMVLRTLDNVTIRRRLHELELLFPHTDCDERIGGFDKIYDDVLELSRCDLYSDHIRRKPLQLILTQIANGNTSHLIQAIVRWPSYEICLFLTDTLLSMPPSWLLLANPRHTRTKMHVRLCQTYDDHLSLREMNGALSLTVFMCNLAKKSTSACRAVIEAGFLDVLLAICLLELEIGSRHFNDHFAESYIRPAYDLAQWNSHLEVFKLPDTLKIYQDHAVRHFWPKLEWNSLHLLERQWAWDSLATNNFHFAVELRSRGLFNTLRRNVFDSTSTSLDVWADLLTFICSEKVDHSTSQQLLDTLVICMNNWPSQLSAFVNAFLDSECEGIVDALSWFFDHVRTEVTTTHPPSFDSIGTVEAILRFFTDIVKNHVFRTQIVLDAGILSLALVILPEELNNPSILHAASPIASTEFLETVRTRGLVPFLKPEPFDSTPRRNTLINAFCVFGGSPDTTVTDNTTSQTTTVVSFESAASEDSRLSSITVTPSRTVTELSSIVQGGKRHTGSRSRSALIRVRNFASKFLQRRPTGEKYLGTDL